MVLNPQQFLPGTEGMRPAKPHQQTETQFLNRPDVFVHGRYMHRGDPAIRQAPISPSYFEFHAGTEKSAHERLDSLGAPYVKHEPVFYHGRVDPLRMQNHSVPGGWESGDVTPTDPGRIRDSGEDWSTDDHDKYYRNDYEDKGSTSVILSTRRTDRGRPIHDMEPTNFTTWRTSVHQAIQSGMKIPAHVRAAYDASGGRRGSHSNLHPEFQPLRKDWGYGPQFEESKSRYGVLDEPFEGMAIHQMRLQGYWKGPRSRRGDSQSHRA